MKLRLNYVVPSGELFSLNAVVDTEVLGFDVWLDHMVKSAPDCIFFYTTDTTDIF